MAKGLPRSLKKAAPQVPAAATASTVGGVKRGVAVAPATDAATALTQLNALIASLKAAGTLA